MLIGTVRPSRLMDRNLEARTRMEGAMGACRASCQRCRIAGGFLVASSSTESSLQVVRVAGDVGTDCPAERKGSVGSGVGTLRRC